MMWEWGRAGCRPAGVHPAPLRMGVALAMGRGASDGPGVSRGWPVQGWAGGTGPGAMGTAEATERGTRGTASGRQGGAVLLGGIALFRAALGCDAVELMLTSGDAAFSAATSCAPF